MKKLIKKTAAAGLAAVFALSLLPISALGASTVTSKVTEYVSNALTYTQTGFTTSGYSQSAYCMELTPGEDIETAVAFGTSVYGGQTLSNTIKGVEAQGGKVIGAINADFFSTATGVPLGILITDGILRSYGGESTVVGFNGNGEAFITQADIAITLEKQTEQGNTGGLTTSFDILALNHYRQGYGVYLFNEDYYATTLASTDGTSVVLRITDGGMTVGGTCTAVVESVITGADPVVIPEGCLVLSADAGYPYYERMAVFKTGDQVTLTVETDSAELLTAQCASGGGDIMIKNGSMTVSAGWDDEISDKRTARTAVGVKADGTVIFYCVDGLQSGYSSGLTMKELAQEMLDMGCVTAINLDGGGSTAMGMLDSSTGEVSVVNSPCDGRERTCSIYILLVAKNASDGVAAHLHFKENDVCVLSGAAVQLEGITATDAGYEPVDVPSGITYFLSGGIGSVSSGLTFTASDTAGSGTITACAADGTLGICSISVIKSPQSIAVSADGEGNITSLKPAANSTVTLTAQAKYLGKQVKTGNGSFSYFSSGDIGSITSGGVFTASSTAWAEGTITVACGNIKKEISVRLRPDFKDVSKDSWYYDAVNYVGEKELFNGTSDTTFSPNVSMTRGMFVTVLGRMAGVDADDYTQAGSGCTVTVDEAYMRSGPDATYGKVISVYYGDKITVNGYENGWCAVSFGEYSGYIREDLLKIICDVTVDEAYIRSGPGTTYDKVASVFSGDKITVNGYENGWYTVSFGDYSGYMREDLLTIIPGFTDVNADMYYAGYINWAVSRGIVGGYGDNTFGPDDPLTREQLAKIIYKYKASCGGNVSIGEESVSAYPDGQSVSDWALDAMNWACSGKLINGMDDGTLVPQGTATRAQVATILRNYLG